ncbi:adenylate kinase family protein [Candidatus Vampirococcus lugosii]|uniref:Adenylate kinase n=1 Tax=Candidatus Vampirococcus lugosii TaxID=2789015 RepID=A0ABS5QK07_9BACT|nr:nucleoside monophosphate kinase [Candidatus Vampirococcus lugosii]MBS8121437.1 adenylate kinase [Candidatus Vampirococcus lugosii]
MNNIVLFGVQGAGKGTQAKMLLNKFSNYKYFEAGNILRAIKSKPNCLGDYVKEIIDSGNLINDEFISSLFNAFLTTLSDNDNILIDGYPRKINQMKQFIDLTSKKNISYKAVYLDLSEDKAIERLSSRLICSNCGATLSNISGKLKSCTYCGSDSLIKREDDYPDAIKKRVRLYKEETKPVIDTFQNMGNLFIIDASGTQEEVFDRIIDIL